MAHDDVDFVVENVFFLFTEQNNNNNCFIIMFIMKNGDKYKVHI